MKRLVTTGIFGTILGIVGAGTANASIVSSGFLDEKLTEMTNATTLQLDGKANQSDLTALSNKIGTLPSGEIVGYGPSVVEILQHYNYQYPKDLAGIYDVLFGTEENIGVLERFATSVLLGAPDSFSGLFSIGTVPDGKNLAGMIDEINTKIGTLPRAISPSAWTAIPYYTERGEIMPNAGIPLPPTLGEQLALIFTDSAESPIDRMFRIMTLAGKDYPVGTMKPGNGDPQAEFLGLNPLTQKVRSIEEIITLPSGTITSSKGLGILIPGTINSTLPTSIRNFMIDIYTGNWSTSALADAVYFGNEQTGQKIPEVIVKGLRQITDEIGTLPSGNFPLVPGYDILFPALNQPPTYPTSLAELITAIYGNSETGASGLLVPIILGLPFDSDGDGRPDDYMGLQPNYLLARSVNNLANANAAKIGTVPDGKNLAGMISETDAKIGTLPAGYDSVGAALSAIKGIAEEAKTAALAAIPDPKQEGSSGKYVLTVDIIGDNATYHWEKIDREGETTTTTTE